MHQKGMSNVLLVFLKLDVAFQGLMGAQRCIINACKAGKS